MHFWNWSLKHFIVSDLEMFDRCANNFAHIDVNCDVYCWWYMYNISVSVMWQGVATELLWSLLQLQGMICNMVGFSRFGSDKLLCLSKGCGSRSCSSRSSQSRGQKRSIFFQIIWSVGLSEVKLLSFFSMIFNKRNFLITDSALPSCRKACFSVGFFY